MRSKQRGIWNDNSGFSLVELMVVLAVTAIMVSLVTITIAVVNNSNVNKAASNFSAVLNRARTESMAKGTEAGRLTLTMENGRLYYQIGDPLSAVKEEICSSLIAVQISDGSGVYDYTDAKVITIRFNTSGMVAADSDPLVSLIFSRGNRRVQTTLYITGKNATSMV